MSAGLSTGLRAKQAVFAIFTAAVADEPTKVHFNHPNGKFAAKEDVFLGDVGKGHRAWRNLGKPPLTNQVDEDYNIAVELEVLRLGTEGQATEERTWAIAALLEVALAENASLDGLVHAALPTDFDMNGEGGKNGWRFTYTFAVSVTARL